MLPQGPSRIREVLVLVEASPVGCSRHLADFRMPGAPMVLNIELERKNMDHTKYTNVDREWQTLAMPVVLILTGLLLITGEGLGILSIVRVENLWPLAVLLIGLSELSPGLADSGAERRQNARR
jgi:hypothetical protein